MVFLVSGAQFLNISVSQQCRLISLLKKSDLWVDFDFNGGGAGAGEEWEDELSVQPDLLFTFVILKEVQ